MKWAVRPVLVVVLAIALYGTWATVAPAGVALAFGTVLPPTFSNSEGAATCNQSNSGLVSTLQCTGSSSNNDGTTSYNWGVTGDYQPSVPGTLSMSWSVNVTGLGSGAGVKPAAITPVLDGTNRGTATSGSTSFHVAASHDVLMAISGTYNERAVMTWSFVADATPTPTATATSANTPTPPPGYRDCDNLNDCAFSDGTAFWNGNCRYLAQTISGVTYDGYCDAGDSAVQTHTIAVSSGQVVCFKVRTNGSLVVDLNNTTAGSDQSHTFNSSTDTTWCSTAGSAGSDSVTVTVSASGGGVNTYISGLEVGAGPTATPGNTSTPTATWTPVPGEGRRDCGVNMTFLDCNGTTTGTVNTGHFGPIWVQNHSEPYNCYNVYALYGNAYGSSVIGCSTTQTGEQFFTAPGDGSVCTHWSGINGNGGAGNSFWDGSTELAHQEYGQGDFTAPNVCQTVTSGHTYGLVLGWSGNPNGWIGHLDSVTFTAAATATPTATPTGTLAATSTFTPGPSHTATPTVTGTPPNTSTPTVTATSTGTVTPVPTGTAIPPSNCSAGVCLQQLVAGAAGYGQSSTSLTVAVSTTVTLTATTNVDVGPSPYFLEIVDQANNLIAAAGSGTQVVGSVSYSSATTVVYRAILTAGTVAQAQAQSNQVVVTWAAQQTTSVDCGLLCTCMAVSAAVIANGEEDIAAAIRGMAGVGNGIGQSIGSVATSITGGATVVSTGIVSGTTGLSSSVNGAGSGIAGAISSGSTTIATSVSGTSASIGAIGSSVITGTNTLSTAISGLGTTFNSGLAASAGIVGAYEVTATQVLVSGLVSDTASFTSTIGGSFNGLDSAISGGASALSSTVALLPGPLQTIGNDLSGVSTDALTLTTKLSTWADAMDTDVYSATTDLGNFTDTVRTGVISATEDMVSYANDLAPIQRVDALGPWIDNHIMGGCHGSGITGPDGGTCEGLNGIGNSIHDIADQILSVFTVGENIAGWGQVSIATVFAETLGAIEIAMGAIGSAAAIFAGSSLIGGLSLPAEGLAAISKWETLVSWITGLGDLIKVGILTQLVPTDLGSDLGPIATEINTLFPTWPDFSTMITPTCPDFNLSFFGHSQTVLNLCTNSFVQTIKPWLWNGSLIIASLATIFRLIRLIQSLATNTSGSKRDDGD